MTKAKERKIIDRNKNVRKDIPENTEGYVEMQTKYEAYTGKEPYLFVRYSHRDTAKVYSILDALYDRKYRLWYDHVLFNKNKSVVIAYPAGSREVQYDIPDSVTVISDRAFCECKKLNRITIPDSVHEIGEGAFCNCALLDEVEIPDSVTAIDDCAFRGCISLEKMIIPSSVVELGWGLFDGCESSITVYCDEGSAIQAYCRRNGIREARISEKENDG